MTVLKSSFQHTAEWEHWELLTIMKLQMHYCNFYGKKRLKKFFIVSDLNFCNTNRETNTSTNNTKQIFINELIRLDLVQCISTPLTTKVISWILFLQIQITTLVTSKF